MSDSRRRALLVALCVASLILAVRHGPRVLQAEQLLRARVRQGVLRLEREQAAVAAFDSLERAAAHAENGLLQLAPMLLAGHSSGEAATNLEQGLRSQVERQNATLQSIAVGPDSVHVGALRRITALLRFECDADALDALLRELGAGPLPVTVDSLEVIATNPDDPAPAPERLRVTMRIRGWNLATLSGNSSR